MSAKELYKIFLKFPLISTDTRKIKSACLFFALKGENYNGNEFASEALKRGAKYAIVDDPDLAKENRIICVDDVLTTLQNLSTYHRSNLKIPIIAITGSNGKTTTKELMNAVLSDKYIVSATKGNLNNHIGVPLTILSFNEKTEIGIVEMGANHLGEIDFLCRITRPDYGIITNIGRAHLEGFGSLEGVLKAKTELFTYLNEHNGKIFCNAQNDLLASKCKKNNWNVIFYGKEGNQVFGFILKNNPFLTVKIIHEDKSYQIKTKLIGNYNFENILAALSIGLEFGINLKDGISRIESYEPDNMRSQWVITRKNHVIADAYNANPTSMKLALENFKNLDVKRKIIILGDMMELGLNETEEHQTIIKIIQSFNFTETIFVGEIFYKLNKGKEIISFRKTEDLIQSGLLNKITGSNILIKGSRAIGLEKIINYL